MGITQSAVRMCLIIMEKHERLQIARKRAGFETASEAARALGVSTQTYAAHENGSRSFKEDSAKKYARRFAVDVMWLIFGTEPMTRPSTEPEVEMGEGGFPKQIDFEIFQKARKEARELEKSMTGGGVSDYDTYKKLLLMTYLDMLERVKISGNNRNNEHEKS